MNTNDKVLQLVAESGPLVPSQISKEIGTDILLASAMLSDLASQNKVRISSIKLGGSPLYYIDGQEDKLQKFVDRLPEREQQAFVLLREGKVLRDISLDPVVRFALRQIKDFAKPLEVTAGGNKEIFWKWYLLPTKEAEPFIKKELAKARSEPEKREERKEEKKEVKPEPKIDVPKPVQPVQEAITERKKEADLFKPLQEIFKKPEVRVEKEIIEKKEIPEKKELKPVRELPKELPKDLPVVKKVEPKLVEKIDQKPENKIKKNKPVVSDPFLRKVEDFFQKNNIEIVEQFSKKKSEAEFVIKVPSAVGALQYYCKAKNKKSCNEADLSEAYVQGQLRKLPTLFLTSGELTKSAHVLLNNEQINISFKKV